MKNLQIIAMEWARRCFGHAHIMNLKIRALRLGEEAIELCQAHSIPKETMLLLVETIYSRPADLPQREIAGVLMTAAVYCESAGLQMDEVVTGELLRVLNKPPEHFTARNREKIDLGLKASRHPVRPPNSRACAARSISGR